MELDTLKEKWAEHDRKLDLNIRLNRRLLLAANLNRVQSPLQRFVVLVSVGAVIGLAGCVLLGQFIYQHWAEPRFALPAAALDAWVIASLAASIRQAAMALQIDYDQPVSAIQKQIESLRMLRIRLTQWALLTGQVVWSIPFLIVALEGLFGVDAYRVFGGAFLLVSLALGVAFIPVAIWVSRRFEARLGASPILRRVMRELAGYNLSEASGFLDTLAEFESENFE